MGYFEEALQKIGSFCKVEVKKIPERCKHEPKNNNNAEFIQSLPRINQTTSESLATDSPNTRPIPLSQIEEPLIDIFEEEDHVKILMQCHCQEQGITFYVCVDGLRICRQKCHVNAHGAEICAEECQKIRLRTEHLQLENRLSIIASCKNNRVLEAMVPKKVITT